jgi:hypothetical protein
VVLLCCHHSTHVYYCQANGRNKQSVDIYFLTFQWQAHVKHELTTYGRYQEPPNGFEPLTCSLQVSCSGRAELRGHIGRQLALPPVLPCKRRECFSFSFVFSMFLLRVHYLLACYDCSTFLFFLSTCSVFCGASFCVLGCYLLLSYHIVVWVSNFFKLDDCGCSVVWFFGSSVDYFDVDVMFDVNDPVFGCGWEDDFCF